MNKRILNKINVRTDCHNKCACKYKVDSKNEQTVYTYASNHFHCMNLLKYILSRNSLNGSLLRYSLTNLQGRSKIRLITHKACAIFKETLLVFYDWFSEFHEDLWQCWFTKPSGGAIKSSLHEFKVKVKVKK